MQNTTFSSSSSTSAAAVVEHDTATPAEPSIKLNQLGVPASVKVAEQAPATVHNKLAYMERERINWETTELAASNKRLYAILKDAYSYYLVMKQDPIKETRAQYADDLDKFIKARGYTFMPSTHDMTRVVKCVFGVDRRRVSAYSIALREALRQGIAAADLVAFLEQNGGVEQIRLGGTKPLSVTARAAKAKDEVLSSELGLFKFDSAICPADADWADKQVVIVATYLPTGEFQANAVLRHDSAVNTALAAYYSQQQAKEREAAKAEREAEKAAAAADKAQAAALKKQEQPAKQQAAIAKAKAAAEQQAAFDAHMQNLFEVEMV